MYGTERVTGGHSIGPGPPVHRWLLVRPVHPVIYASPAIHSLPPPDGRTGQEGQRHHGTIPEVLCLSPTGRLGCLPRNGRVPANNHVSDTTGVSSSLAKQGHHPRMNYTTTSPLAAEAPLPLNDFVNHMTKAHDHLCAKMSFVQDKQEQHANTTPSPAPRLASNKEHQNHQALQETRPQTSRTLHHQQDCFPLGLTPEPPRIDEDPPGLPCIPVRTGQ